MIIFFRNIFFYIKNIEKLIIKTNISQPITGLLGGGMHRNDRIIIYLGLVLVVIALVGAAVGGSPKGMEEDFEPELDITDWPIVRSQIGRIVGEELQENTNTTIMINNINESYLITVYFELHWEDEANSKEAGLLKIINEPDYFHFEVFTPWEELFISEMIGSSDGTGQILMDVPVPDDEDTLGEWQVTIYCHDCGDQASTGPLGTTVEEDTGNGWALTYYYSFYSNN